MTSPAGRWKLDVRSRAQRQLAGLPEKIAAAAAGFITGPLLDNPRRVGHPLRDEYAGSIPPAAGLTGACVIGSTRTATRWSSWTFLTGPTPTVHERSTPVAGNWPLYRLIASWSLRVAGSTPERTRTEPPYLYRPMMQVVRRWLIRRELPWFWACLSLLPAPDSCRVLRPGGPGQGPGGSPAGVAGALEGVLDAAARERIMPGGRGREGLGVVRVFAVGVLAFLSGVTSRGGRGRGKGQPALPGSAGRGSLPRRQDD